MKIVITLFAIVLVLIRLFFWLICLPDSNSIFFCPHVISLIAFIVAFLLIFNKGDEAEVIRTPRRDCERAQKKHKILVVLLSTVSLIIYGIIAKLDDLYYTNERLYLDEFFNTNARPSYQYALGVFRVVNSVVGVWLAALIRNIFKNPWAALVAYIFPPIAIIAALLPRRNVED